MAELGFEIYVPKEGESAESIAKNLYSSFLDFVEQVKWWAKNVNNDNITSLSFDKLTGGSIDLKGGITISGEKLTTILDEFGLDVRFLKWYPNKIKNSSFEIFNGTTPLHWAGTGTVSTASVWDESHSLKLEPGQYEIQAVAAGANPQWWNSMSKATRVSFHKKGGAVTISVLDSSNADTPFEIYKQEGNHGASLEYPYNADWVAQSYSIKFNHGSCTKMLVRFENTDSTYDAYIDGIIGEPDYTRKRPSMYTSGPDSIGDGYGYTSGYGMLTKDYNATNSAQVTVDTSEDTIVTKTIALDNDSDLKVLFTCQGLANDALSLTLKTYAGATAQTLQPVHDIFGANKVMLTLTDTIAGQAAGSVTIAVKGTASNGTFIIAAEFATMDIIAIPLTSTIELDDVTGLTATAISSSEIDLVWTNPTSSHFTSVELYSYATTLAAHDRAWCLANATPLYSGALEVYNNTGLDGGTEYFYKIFAVHNDGGTYYSDGVTDSATTPILVQQWEDGVPDSPVPTDDYPYQCIEGAAIPDRLFVATDAYFAFGYQAELTLIYGTAKRYDLVDDEWVFVAEYVTTNDVLIDTGAYQLSTRIYQCNYTIREQGLTGGIVKSKTTP
jgi:hypothetical protein